MPPERHFATVDTSLTSFCGFPSAIRPGRFAGSTGAVCRTCRNRRLPDHEGYVCPNRRIDGVPVPAQPIRTGVCIGRANCGETGLDKGTPPSGGARREQLYSKVGFRFRTTRRIAVTGYR